MLIRSVVKIYTARNECNETAAGMN